MPSPAFKKLSLPHFKTIKPHVWSYIWISVCGILLSGSLLWKSIDIQLSSLATRTYNAVYVRGIFLNSRIQSFQETLSVLSNQFIINPNSTLYEFQSLSKAILSRSAMEKALEMFGWIPNLPNATLYNYELLAQQLYPQFPHHLHFHIKQPYTLPSLAQPLKLNNDSTIYPLMYVSPLKSNVEVLGRNIAGYPNLLSTLELTLQRKATTLSPKVLISKNDEESVVMMAPIINNNEVTGINLMAITLSSLFEIALNSITWKQGDQILICDLTNSSISLNESLLYTAVQQGNSQIGGTTPEVFQLPALKGLDLIQRCDLDCSYLTYCESQYMKILGRTWMILLNSTARPNYMTPLILLSLIISITVIMLAIVYTTSRQVATTRKVIECEKQAKDLACKGKQLAEETNKCRDTFLANISCQLKIPMNGVIQVMDFIAKTNLDKEQQDLMLTMNALSEHLDSLLYEIGDLANMKSGKIKINCQPFDLHSCIQSIHRIAEVKSRTKNISLLLQINSELPKVVLGDMSRIRQICLNMLDNAIKFSNAGGKVIFRVEEEQDAEGTDVDEEMSEDMEKPSSNTTMRPGGNKNYYEYEYKCQTPMTLCFTFEDEGIGMAEEEIPQIFNCFTQVDMTTTRKYSGVGLGLCICNNLIQLMNGTIAVQSSKEKGTLFQVKIRLSKLWDH